MALQHATATAIPPASLCHTGKALLADFGVAKLTGGPAPVAMGWGDEPPAKRFRSSSSSASGGSSTGWRSAGNSPAVSSAAVTWSPVPAPVHSSEDTDWIKALLNEVGGVCGVCGKVVVRGHLRASKGAARMDGQGPRLQHGYPALLAGRCVG